jgi:hypothetical protein
MPSVSKKQHNLMAMVANDPKAAKRMKIPQSVGKDFLDADKGKKFKGGGMAMKHEDVKMDKKMAKKAVGMHEAQLHGGKKSDMSKLKKGGCAKMASGGYVRAADGCATRGKTKGKMV